MTNRDIQAAWAYHNGTKHSYESIRRNPHYLDWDNQPVPFKIYTELEPIPLVQHLSSSGMAALSAVAGTGPSPDQAAPVTSQSLAEILFLSAGITRRRKYPGGEILFRAAACTGALYHVDLYIVCGDLDDLEAGVYQFSPQDFSLRKLRAGDYRACLAHASGEEPSIAHAQCAIVSASTFWRNAWKYQSRAYRHCYWDNGTIMANLLAAAAARRIGAQLVLGFVDATVSQILGLDSLREASLSIVSLGLESPRQPSPVPPLEPIRYNISPLSKREVDYPMMREMHAASSLESTTEVMAWRGGTQGGGMKDEGGKRIDESTNELFALQPLHDDEIPQETIEEVIIRRGSTREFTREAMTFAELSTMLDRATGCIKVDFTDDAEAPLNEVFLIVHAVDGLQAGAYVYRRDERALELLKAGDFRRHAGHLGLGQAIPADCSVNVYFLTDLHDVLARLGNRGYRAAQLEAAIMGGKLYLAAYAQRLGASGLTFFDDDVVEFFSPRAAGMSVMFLIALGKSAKRRS
jgi:SagB-type dehydrogenase family enzyme